MIWNKIIMKYNQKNTVKKIIDRISENTNAVITNDAIFTCCIDGRKSLSIGKSWHYLRDTENIGHHPVTKHIKRLEHHIPLRTNRET